MQIKLNGRDLEIIERRISAEIFAKISENYQKLYNHDPQVEKYPYSHNYTGKTGQRQYIKSSEIVKEIVFDSPNLKWIENGTAPRSKYPPIARGSGRYNFLTSPPIMKWVRLKLGITKKKELRSVTWKILRSIKRKGTKDYHILERSIDEFVVSVGGTKK